MTTELAARSTLKATHSERESARLGTAGLAVLLVGVFMAVADFFIVNVALATIDRTLNAGPAALELVVAGYGTAYAVFLVLGGRLGDAHGRRRLFLGGIAGFALTSALCGLAPSAYVLVAARILQGATAAALVPQVLATIQATLSGEDRQRALALYGAALGAAAVAGQLLGGIIVQANIAGLGWRPVFLVNVPIGLIGLALAPRLVPDTRSSTPSQLDIRGASLLAIALLALLIPATMGRELGWPVWSLACLPIAPIALVGLIQHGRGMERSGTEPLLPPSLLALPGMRAGLGVAVGLFLAAGGFFLTTAITLQEGLRFGPLAAALTMVPAGLAFFATSILGRRVASRLGNRAVVLGAVLFATGMASLALEATLFYRSETTLTLAPAMALVGLGQGMVVAPLFGIVLAGVPSDRAGAASGILSTTIQASLAIGATTISLIFLGVLGSGDPSGYAHATASAATVQSVLGFGVAWLARTTLPGA